MAIKTSFTQKEDLFRVPLPQHAATYTVISHESIVKHAINELSRAGFGIRQEVYKKNINGEVAYGIYNLDHSKDKALSMMFAWSNTYDKSRRFRCAIGAEVTTSSNHMITGDVASYARKHTGNADQQALDHIIEQIKLGVDHYTQIITDKEQLLNTTLTVRQQSEILGILVHEKEVINLTQLALIQKELKRPSFNYNYDKDSAFLLYNHIGHSLKDSHPSVWMDNHQEVHRFFINEFGQISDALAANQASVEEAIKEMMRSPLQILDKKEFEAQPVAAGHLVNNGEFVVVNDATNEPLKEIATVATQPAQETRRSRVVFV